MATCIDITDKLTQEQKSIKLGGKEYPVDDSKNTMIEVMAMLQNAVDVDAIDNAMRKLLGDEAAAEINAFEIDGQKLNFDSYHTIFVGVMAAATGVDYDTALARFQQG